MSGLPYPILYVCTALFFVALVLAPLLFTGLAVLLLKRPVKVTRVARLRRWLPALSLLAVAPAVLILSEMIAGDVRAVFVSQIGWRLLLANSAHGVVACFALLIAHVLCRAWRITLPDGVYRAWFMAALMVYVHLLLAFTGLAPLLKGL